MSDPKQQGGGSHGAPAEGRAPAAAEVEDAATPAAPTQPPSPADDYKVGPGRPPKETRFKKGVSGNPSGRRKGGEGFWDIVLKVAYDTVRVKDRGELSRIEVLMRQMFDDAIKGDKKSRAQCIDLMLRYAPPPPPTNDNDEVDADHYRQVIDAFLAEMRAKGQGQGGDDEDR